MFWSNGPWMIAITAQHWRGLKHFETDRKSGCNSTGHRLRLKRGSKDRARYLIHGRNKNSRNFYIMERDYRFSKCKTHTGNKFVLTSAQVSGWCWLIFDDLMRAEKVDCTSGENLKLWRLQCRSKHAMKIRHCYPAWKYFSGWITYWTFQLKYW